MASGKTLDMIALSRQFSYRVQEERPARERDRSIPGRRRVRARKAKKYTDGEEEE